MQKETTGITIEKRQIQLFEVANDLNILRLFRTVGQGKVKGNRDGGKNSCIVDTKLQQKKKKTKNIETSLFNF